jgi:hypothetical protein
MRYALLVIGLAVAATVATYARYESLDPCDWMEQDLARQSGLPLIVVRARIRAEFLLEGITEPTAADCLSRWWEIRADGLTEGT